MINLHESYVAELGFELATPGSEVRRATDCAIEAGVSKQAQNLLFRVNLNNTHPS